MHAHEIQGLMGYIPEPADETQKADVKQPINQKADDKKANRKLQAALPASVNWVTKGALQPIQH